MDRSWEDFLIEIHRRKSQNLRCRIKSRAEDPRIICGKRQSGGGEGRAGRRWRAVDGAGETLGRQILDRVARRMSGGDPGRDPGGDPGGDPRGEPQLEVADVLLFVRHLVLLRHHLLVDLAPDALRQAVGSVGAAQLPVDALQHLNLQWTRIIDSVSIRQVIPNPSIQQPSSTSFLL